jgi:hypothetical protein
MCLYIFTIILGFFNDTAKTKKMQYFRNQIEGDTISVNENSFGRRKIMFYLYVCETTTTYKLLIVRNQQF